MILSAVLALSVAQCGPPYNRTKVDDADPMSHSLYWREGTTIVWNLNDKGNPENDGSEVPAVEASFNSWQAVMNQCGSLNFQEGPRTANRKAEYSASITNQNVVLWRFKKCTEIVSASDACHKNDNCGSTYDCWDHSGGALAITTTSFDPTSGRILDADIELNTPYFLFTTVDSPPCTGTPPVYMLTCVASDVQNALTHEIGHMLGLAHNCDPGSTMYTTASPGELTKRTIDDGSKRFVCDTYPNDGGHSNSGSFLFAVEGCYPDGGGPRDAGCKGSAATLGKPASSGCAVAPGAWGVFALLGLWWRRNRSPREQSRGDASEPRPAPRKMRFALGLSTALGTNGSGRASLDSARDERG
jgi:hypothetical protein